MDSTVREQELSQPTGPKMCWAVFLIAPSIVSINVSLGQMTLRERSKCQIYALRELHQMGFR